MTYKIYLAGEIHSDWREQLMATDLPVEWLSPVTNHEDSDDCGAAILGCEENAYWDDHKGAGMNAVRTRTMIKHADIVVVKFGEKYRQWNAAFDAGMAVALGKQLIVIHPDEFEHALKELDAAASVVAKSTDQVIHALKYITTGVLDR